ncbi:MAG: YceI family protein [Anaerolineales bacterium]|nr:YceI family protein [Anaerolineales bacterium]
MFSSRFVPTIFSAVIFGIVLAGCGAATEQPPAQPPASEAAAPTNTPAPAVVEEPATPTLAPTTQEPTAAAPAAPAATEEAASAAPTEPEAAEASASLRTFQIVPEQSEATYQVQEEFFNRPVNIVNPIGRTQAIEGEFQLTISGSNQVQLADNQFKVDLRTLASDEARRDNRIRDEWLESNKYPWAEFKATTIEDFPANAAEGQDVSFKVTGDMTIREITKPQTFAVTARLDGDTFTGTATSYVLMQDYGFEPPSILGVLEVTDGVTVTVNFTAAENQTGS